MQITRDQLRRLIFDQLEALQAVCDRLGANIVHIKPHGALYNQAAKDPEIARALAETVAEFDPGLIFYGFSGSLMIEEAERTGLKATREVFADRTYQSDGSLTPRSRPDAMVTDSKASINQVLDIVKYGRVRSVQAIMVPVKAETICIHGDGPNSVELASSIKRALTNEGFRISHPHDLKNAIMEV